MKTLDQVAKSSVIYDVIAWGTPGLRADEQRIVATFLRPDDACKFAKELPDKCGEKVQVVMRGQRNEIIQ